MILPLEANKRVVSAIRSSLVISIREGEALLLKEPDNVRVKNAVKEWKWLQSLLDKMIASYNAVARGDNI